MTEDSTDSFEIARFAIDLRLPAADDALRKEAANAIRQEHRHSSHWKRLTCRKVSLFAERDRGTVCIVQLDGAVEFDWTWEGALAFRPRHMDDASPPRLALEEVAYEDEIQWQGEVLEVDERNGCLFICLENPETFPVKGDFFVRPFEYLSVLDSVVNSEDDAGIRQALPARLAATQGGIHPRREQSRRVGLPKLQNWWNYAWSVLWGPPGTGKTWTTGQQVAAVLEDPTERILVVSTTNRATDAVALAIGEATRRIAPGLLEDGQVLRIGKGAVLRSFASADLEGMLHGTESAVLHEIDQLASNLRQQVSRDEKAYTRKRMGELRKAVGDQSKRNFLDSTVRVVVATAFKATSYLGDPLIQEGLGEDTAPFTTIFIDEAGLMSRVAVAALSLLAARRVVLVGDSKQLSPISRLSRILPIRQQRWMASSALSHLTGLENTPAAVMVLSEQRRMHPDVCRLVSQYQYGGQLTTARETVQRCSKVSKLLTSYSRTIWYVLDDDAVDLSMVRARRGPSGKSWIREITPSIIAKLFQDLDIKQSQGLFISPFAAQAQVMASLFASEGLGNWEASTVHSQQGSEADIVIFDTVNASSYTWPYDEWKRLVNVALSRAREAVLVLASRNEMDEPYLRPLLKHLRPSRLDCSGAQPRWQSLSRSAVLEARDARERYDVAKPTNMGEQIRQRKQLKPGLSQEQQRLTNTELDGKPRLVRGVAGSGKSYVMCTWLARTVMRMSAAPERRIWAVYANRSLHKLLRESIESAWKQLWQESLFEAPEFPWGSVTLLHVRDVLSGILPGASLSMEDFEFDYDRAAEEYLQRQDLAELLPSCSTIFIDEAQDMGPSTLKLLLAMVEQSDKTDPNSRAAHIFYDNAQNIYGTRTPRWSEFGLDMRGRATIMRESFRSTMPITELAINVLYRLTPSGERDDQQELIEMGLLTQTTRQGAEWLEVAFSQVDGPQPILRVFDKAQDELTTLAQHLSYLIQKEGISPADICVIYNGRSMAEQLMSGLAPQMDRLGVDLSLQTNRAYERHENTLVVTTAHSYKGYESEVVVIPGVDQFVGADGQILAKTLYVAMTRARSLLALYGLRHGPSASNQLMQTLTRCFDMLSKKS